MNQMMMQAMQAMQEAQKRMGEIQEQLKNLAVKETGGGDIVTVTVTGEGVIAKLEIKEEAMRNEDKEMMEDLILTTVNKAIASATTMRERAMQEATKGLMPNIPGLGSMFGM